MKWTASVAAAAAVLCLASVQACSNGFINLADKGKPEVCMYFLRLKSTWYGMREHCQALGGDLAKLTENLHHNVMQYISNWPDLESESFWIGGTDQVHEGSWEWIDGTEIPQGSPHWYPCRRRTEPDGDIDQNYLCLPKTDFYFHSCNGKDEMYGICQHFQ